MDGALEASDTPSELHTFPALIFASVCWIVLVVILLPRFLGRIFAFFANRSSRGVFHIAIPILHFYPLAGRVVIHSLQCTVPDGTVSVEELVLQVRWWRKAHDLAFATPLVVDHASQLDPVAAAQQEIIHENAAFFIKRIGYRLRRWWRRSAATADHTHAEPAPLISLIAVGLRARLVNLKANYDRVDRVLELAKASSKPSSSTKNSSMDTQFEIPIPAFDSGNANASADPTRLDLNSSTSSLTHSVSAKPLRHRLLELVSLRITSGAFYFCDMGQSPLVRVAVDSAKIRYRYGAPGCELDESRKRFRFRLTGLKLSVADMESVRHIVESSRAPSVEPVVCTDSSVRMEPSVPAEPLLPSESFTPATHAPLPDNTNHMIERVLSEGFHGIHSPCVLQTASAKSVKRPRGSSFSEDIEKSKAGRSRRGRASRLISRPPIGARHSRSKQSLTCTDVLNAETAVIDYVFDEPGPIDGRRSHVTTPRQPPMEMSSEGNTEGTDENPSPVCRVSVVLRGAKVSYDFDAVSNLERVLERLQPALYDLVALAVKVRTDAGVRSPTGMQLEIEAVPVEAATSSDEEPCKLPPLLCIPFDARPVTWTTLTTARVRTWQRSGDEENLGQDTDFCPPQSRIDVHASHLSIRTEIPFNIGAEQRVAVTAEQVNASVLGITDIPFIRTEQLRFARVVKFPVIWNGVHSSSIDCKLKRPRVFYVPDISRVLADLGASFRASNRNPRDIRYFVPWKDTTKVRAEGKYDIVIACSYENAWADIGTEKGDEYGKVVVSGESAELQLSQSIPTQYMPDAATLSWSLALPAAVGGLELSTGCDTDHVNKTGVDASTFKSTASFRSFHHKARPPSFAQRYGKFETQSSYARASMDMPVKEPEAVRIQFIQTGKSFQLTGKTVICEDRTFLNHTVPTFVDSVDRIDMDIRSSSLEVDLNPHHVSHLLNLIRNYAGSGNHSLSLAERSLLHRRRRGVANVVLAEQRLPNMEECIILGLPAGQTLASSQHRRGMDELFYVSFEIDSFILRAYDLPHALCNFVKTGEKVCRLQAGSFSGVIAGSRSGMKAHFSPVSSKNLLSLQGGFEHVSGVDTEQSGLDSMENSTSPVVLVEQLHILKRTFASSSWGSYHSTLTIRVGKVNGCIADTSIITLFNLGRKCVPDRHSDDQMAVASLLSVENIDVDVDSVDILILASSSKASTERSGQLGRSPLRGVAMTPLNSEASLTRPAYLTGVAALQAPYGLRYCTSNLASKVVENGGRLLLPNLSLDLLVSWAGKRTPWVDNATIRAEVAHALMLPTGMSRNSLQGDGVLQPAANVKEVSVEMVTDSRPRTWSTAVEEIQRRHVSLQNESSRGCHAAWCLRTRCTTQEMTEPLSSEKELELHWWTFLSRAKRASMLKTHKRYLESGSGTLDSLSVCIRSDAQLVLSPASLEFANDIIARTEERLRDPMPDSLRSVMKTASNSFRSVQSMDNELEPYENASRQILSRILTETWEAYEADRSEAFCVSRDGTELHAFRALELERIVISFISPPLPDGVSIEGRLFASASAGDVVRIAAPLGIGLLTASDREEVSEPLNVDASRGDKTIVGNVEQKRVVHLSVPVLSIVSNDKSLCAVNEITIVRRSHAKTATGTTESPSQGACTHDEKSAIVGKVASVDIGNANSELPPYASFGRVLSIFSLLSRALALELAKLSTLRLSRRELFLRRILSIPGRDLSEFKSESVRASLAEVSRIIAGQELMPLRGSGEVGFAENSSILVAARGEERDPIIRKSATTSLDLSVRKILFNLCNEEIIRLHALRLEGGFVSGFKLGDGAADHILKASIGVIHLSIRDDVVRNTLSMVAEVALFVRRATFSIPMLRYDPNRRPHVQGASSVGTLPFGRPSSNQTGSKTGKAGRVTERHRHWQIPARPHFLTGRHQQVHSTLTKRVAKSSQRRRSRTSAELWRGSSQHNPRISSVHFADTPESVRQTAGRGSSSEGRLAAVSKATVEPAGESATSHSGTPPGQTRRRPLSMMETDGSYPRSRLSAVSLPVAEAGGSNLTEKRRDSSSDGSEHFAYVAIPTAGDTGPPRKRSKSRVRISTAAPPTFSDFDHNAFHQRRIGMIPASVGNEISANGRPDVHQFRPDVKGHHAVQGRQYEQLQPYEASNRVSEVISQDVAEHTVTPETTSFSAKTKPSKKRFEMTLVGSCREIICQYFRAKSLRTKRGGMGEAHADLKFSVAQPRMTLVSSAEGSQSLVLTAASAGLASAQNPNCVLTGSTERIGVTVSIAQRITSSVPQLIASVRISAFKTTLHATDLRSVSMFREEFKSDIKAILSAFVTTKFSISEMAQATRLSSSRTAHANRTAFSTMAFDVLCEDSRVKLLGFHPEDGGMCVSYLLDGMFFSVVASEDENAALTSGVRLHGHGLTLSSPSWPCDQTFHFPNFDARGVQWGETTGLPTFLKVSAEPLTISTSIQGVRQVLFTVAGLLAFQSSSVPPVDNLREPSTESPEHREHAEPDSSNTAGTNPFSRSLVAWERTKGVRMDISVRPVSINLASGPVLARFDMHATTGICEWNKLVDSGVQLHSAVSVPRLSLMFTRMSSPDYVLSDVRPDEKRASMSLALENCRIDILKAQADLTHTFTLRLVTTNVSGQIRPWNLLLDIAYWADEQEFVTDLQSINNATGSSSRARSSKPSSVYEASKPLEHRVILLGANVKRFKLAVPLLSNEGYLTSRLAFRVTELHLLLRQRFDSAMTLRRNIVEVRGNFLGMLWENAALLSSHHAKMTVGIQRAPPGSPARYSAIDIVVVAGTWRICPRKDVVTAILEAKNGKENREAARKSREMFSTLPDLSSKGGSVGDDSFPNTSDRQNLGFAEHFGVKILRTSGFIEGLDAVDTQRLPEAGSSRSQALRIPQASRLTVPAFSAAFVRNSADNFDLVDIDFSGREGEFPRACLQKATHLISDLFGTVASDQRGSDPERDHVQPMASGPQASRDVSLLVRFGNSLYRAQEELNAGVESKLCFFAGRSSAILISATTCPLFSEESGHSTVITGVSPKLALEIMPVVDEAEVQTLRLLDGRLFHGINCRLPSHTLLHVAEVIAVMDAKTLLLTEKRVHAERRKRKSNRNDVVKVNAQPFMESAERNILAVLGGTKKAARTSRIQTEASYRLSRAEPKLRVQLKLPTQGEQPTNQVDWFVELLHLGVCRAKGDSFLQSAPLNVHVAVHEVNLRGRWDILSCQLRLRENLFSFSTSGVPPRNSGNITLINILNRLQFESLQYGTHTMKLSVDALAALLVVPDRRILIESTAISAEVSYTMVKSVSRLSGQLKKLRNEAKLLMKREASRMINQSSQSHLWSNDSKSAESLKTTISSSRIAKNEPKRGHRHAISLSASTFSNTLPKREEFLKRTRKETGITVKGESLRLKMHGYQFDESRHSAIVSLVGYGMRYTYKYDEAERPKHMRQLGIDFSNMKVTYNDEERGIHSDLCKIPGPSLSLLVVDTDKGLHVELLGKLELKIGPGFLYWQEYKKLVEQTIKGITRNQDADELPAEALAAERPEVWDGRPAQVSVKLKPRIDVIGDLTTDMLQFVAARQGRVDIVPKQLYDYVVVPLEKFSEAICGPLCK